MCFPSCPRHSARLLRACRTHLLRAPQPTVARGAHLASVPGSLHRMHMRTARRHVEQAHALGRDAPTCFLSDPVKVRPGLPPIPPATASRRLASSHLVELAAPRPRMVQPLITRALRPGHALPAPLARMYRCTRKDSPQPAPAPAQHAPSQLDHFLTRRPSSPDRCVTAILKPRRPPSPTPSGPTPLCPTPPPAATRPRLSRGTHPARGPRPPVRATAFSFLSPPSLS